MGRARGTSAGRPRLDEAGVRTVYIDERAEVDAGSDVRFMSDLAAELAGAPTGLSFVYRALEAVAVRFRLLELMAVVDVPAADRQAFRIGRRTLVPQPQDRVRRMAAAAQPGLHAEPPLVDPMVSGFVTNLISLAVRLDIVRHDASHDSLTGLLNRRSYEDMLDQAVSRSLRYGWPFALMVLDLNAFKSVNDRLGHAAGDVTLRAVGMELRHSLRAGDVAARIGGDEFALILANGSPEVLRPLLERLEQSVNDAVPDANVSFSAGLARFPEEAPDAETLSRLADQRLYAAKP
jgi:diguanylate cyclase (GGDEF)-like protein